jgi:uncharacterized protein YoxC
MSLDERIKQIARQVAAEHTTTPTDGELAVAVAALGSKLDDLHKELHQVATRVTALEQQPEPTAGSTGQASPAARRPRKAADE